jgi:hypothetical protein
MKGKRESVLKDAVLPSPGPQRTAVAIADEAVRAAEALRRADAERKGRGRLARLRAAWWGE